MKRMLITGAAGNLGRTLSELAIGRFETFGIDLDNWDDLDPILERGMDVVVHAAHDLRTAVADHPRRIVESNIGITGLMLERSRDAGVPRFVYVSSAAVYGDVTSTDELAPCRPTSLYGRIKLLNEELVEQFCVKHGMEYLIVRPFNLFGGRDTFSVLRRLADAIIEDRPFTLNNRGVAMRDFIHVEDAASVILLLLDEGCPFPKINLGTGHATRLGDIVARVRATYPGLVVVSGASRETEYCRADTTRLEELVSMEFRTIEEMLPTEISRLVARGASRHIVTPIAAAVPSGREPSIVEPRYH